AWTHFLVSLQRRLRWYVMRHSQVQEEKAVLLNYLFLNVDSLIFRSPSLEELLTGKATFLCQI
ncbi:MAG TPA: hypothetical protein PKV80_25850, partial [Leptospiraceae bacterium]|nr:hypothetical protein [Leptospiraceae bacterium]